MMMGRQHPAALFWALALVVLIGVVVHACTKVDRCLDRGGRWDHDADVCRYE